MKYLIVQQWENTKGNHAGMSHMCDLLVSAYPNDYKKIEMDCPTVTKTRKNRVVRKLLSRYDEWALRRKYLRKYLLVCNDMFQNIQEDDEVFLLEYHIKHVPQYDLALYIKKHFTTIHLYALSHLTPTFFKNKKKSTDFIMTWEKCVDKQLTLGTSLSNFFVSIGIPSEKISTGFHYVDATYYQRSTPKKQSGERLTAIVMGGLQRNFQLIASVVKKTPSINWIICCGKKNVQGLFDNYKNVQIYGYIKEDELKFLMEESDISVNIMEDTVGSNVITTSMAMGLAIISSDVGSIHDYCSNKNTIFCENNEESFVDAINSLVDSPQRIASMQENSILMSQKFHISNIHRWFCSLKK